MGVEDYEFRPLNVESEIKPFHSANDDLNDFLRDDAKKYLSDLMAVTYLLEDNANGRTVAYFSLLNDKIVTDEVYILFPNFQINFGKSDEIKPEKRKKLTRGLISSFLGQDRRGRRREISVSGEVGHFRPKAKMMACS